MTHKSKRIFRLSGRHLAHSAALAFITRLPSVLIKYEKLTHSPLQIPRCLLCRDSPRRFWNHPGNSNDLRNTSNYSTLMTLMTLVTKASLHAEITLFTLATVPVLTLPNSLAVSRYYDYCFILSAGEVRNREIIIKKFML